MLVLDTNVLSETVKQIPNPAVMAWLESQPDEILFTTAVTQAEIFCGIWALPDGRRREGLAAAADAMFEHDFHERVLPFDSACTAHYAAIMVNRKTIGRFIAQLDAQIAAIARCHKATVVTRNVKDFEACGVSLINPWVTD